MNSKAYTATVGTQGVHTTTTFFKVLCKAFTSIVLETGSLLGRCWVDVGSVLDRSWVGVESVLHQCWVDLH